MSSRGGTEIFQVDAFTDRAFAGNPAAVCELQAPRDEEWMQALAAEMNLSETAFLERRDDGWGLRWFTPATEVDLCGHATLASAHVLWEQGRLAVDQVAAFDTRSGRLTARREGEEIVLDFPALPSEPVDEPRLAPALGVEPRAVGRNRLDFIVELASEAEVRALAPDFAAIRELESVGVIVTARAETEPFDFVSRYFAPSFGIDEDPVTGAAHCGLAPYWSERLGRSELLGFQASRRGGVVRVRHRGERVDLGGRAVTVMRGELLGGAA